MSEQPPVKGLVIRYDGTTEESIFATLRDFQTAVHGNIEAVGLNDRQTMYVHDEGLLDDQPVNGVATTLAVQMGRGDVAGFGIRGDVVVVGPLDGDKDTDVLPAMLKAVELIKALGIGPSIPGDGLPALLGTLDPGIADVVLALRAARFRTRGSCQGHPEDPTKDRWPVVTMEADQQALDVEACNCHQCLTATRNRLEAWVRNQGLEGCSVGIKRFVGGGSTDGLSFVEVEWWGPAQLELWRSSRAMAVIQ